MAIPHSRAKIFTYHCREHCQALRLLRGSLLFLSPWLRWHLLNCSPDSKGSAVSVLPVVIESRLKFDKWLCHSAEKQNSVDKVTKSFPAWEFAFTGRPCAISKTRKHMVFPVPPATLQEMPGFGSSRMYWLKMPAEETGEELLPHPDMGALCLARWLPSHPSLPPAVPVQSHIYTLIVTLTHSYKCY